MIKSLPQKIEQHFQDNLKDWCLGGPKPDGWTRRGFPTFLPPVRLVDYSWGELPVEECLAKNRAETARWHLGFLNTLLSLGKRKFYWKKTLYYREYLKPRYDDKAGYARAKSFIDLFDDILDNGVRKAVMVADLEDLKLKFRYFRFDGCHRICCAKIIGDETVPALIFKVERCEKSDLFESHAVLQRKYGYQASVISANQHNYLL